MDPYQVTPAVLARARQALMEVPSFEFGLNRVGRFPATAYLAPEPPSAFAALTSALVRAIPEFPAYGGEHANVIPHLTVAHGDAQSAALGAVELEKKLRITGPIAARCVTVELIENSTGRWKELQVFDLPLSTNV